MLNSLLAAEMNNKTMLLVLMIVLIAFIVLMVILGVVFVVALRKRAPVVKIVMAPDVRNDEPEEEVETQEPVDATAPQQIEAQPAAVVADAEPDEPEDSDGDEMQFITEGEERVRYDRSLTAKLAQVSNESKEWYSQIKNELLSFEKVKSRMSWRKETFRLGKMTFARIMVRGKTLCLLLAVEPEGYKGTKYAVEDVSNVASTADTPSLYRIKSARRLKLAKEMIAGIMRELKAFRNSHYEPQDFFIPHQGDMTLMQKGLVKRVVTGSTRTFRIEEVDDRVVEAAATTDDAANKK